MVQKALYKSGKKPKTSTHKGAGLGAKEKRVVKVTTRGRRFVKAKAADAAKHERLNHAISCQINGEIEKSTASQAYGHGSSLKVVKAEKPAKPEPPKRRKASSLPAHKTQK